MTLEARIVRWLRKNPRSSPREVAAALQWTRTNATLTGHQLNVGMRLSKLANRGVLTRVFNCGWRFSVSEEVRT